MRWELLLVIAILTAGCVGEEQIEVSEETGITKESPGAEVENSFETAENQDAGNLTITLLDVRESILITTPHGKRILVDGGENDITGHLAEKGVASLDAVVLTHPHGDHFQGLLHLFERDFPVRKFYHNGDIEEAGVVGGSEIAKLMREKPEGKLERGDEIRVDSSVEMRVLWPEEIEEEGNGNRNSLVIKLTYGDFSALLTGDCNLQCEDGLLSSGEELDADVLKAGHHGLLDASSPEFLDAVSPEAVFFSIASYANLAKFDAPVYVDEVNGEVEITSNGEGFEVRTERKDEEAREMLETQEIAYERDGVAVRAPVNHELFSALKWVSAEAPDDAVFLGWWDEGQQVHGMTGREVVIDGPSRAVLKTVAKYAAMSEEELREVECEFCDPEERVRKVADALLAEGGLETAKAMKELGASHLLVSQQDRKFLYAISLASSGDSSPYLKDWEPTEKAEKTLLFRAARGEELEGLERVYGDENVFIYELEEV